MVPKEFTINQTQYANFTCTAFGIPIPQLTWFKGDSTSAVQQTNLLMVTNEVFTNTTGLGHVRSQLIFPMALRTDQSSYTCVAVNNITNLLTTPENGTTQFYIQGTVIVVIMIFLYSLYSPSIGS